MAALRAVSRASTTVGWADTKAALTADWWGAPKGVMWVLSKDKMSVGCSVPRWVDWTVLLLVVLMAALKAGCSVVLMVVS